MADTPKSLEEEARKRKERLQLLRQKRGSAAVHEGAEENQPEAGEQPEPKKPTFRSYAPVTETLAEKRADTQPEQIEPEIAEHLSRTKDTSVVKEIDLTTLAPRKVDWDLKRDVAKRLEKLERRTQRAIAELIRERLSESAESARDSKPTSDGADLLLSAINSNARAAENAHSSDDDDDDD